MIKRWIVYLLVLAFLNLIIAPDFVFAKSRKEPLPDWSGLFEEPSAGVLLIGLGLTLGVIFIVSAILNPSNPSTEKPKDQNVEPIYPSTEKPKDQNQDIEIASNSHDKPLTLSWNVVVFRW